MNGELFLSLLLLCIRLGLCALFLVAGFAKLADLAGVLIVFGRTNAGFDPGSWFGTLTLVAWIALIGGAAVLVVLIGILWLLTHILRQQGRLLLRIEAAESRLGKPDLSTPSRGA